MNAVPELEARNLSVEYDDRNGVLPALHGIDLEIAPGAFVAILGPSGSGKTTLLNVFAGFVAPTDGVALFRGEPITAPSVERAVVFQRHALFPWLDVADNVAFPLKVRRVDRRRRRQMIAPLLARVGLAEFARHPVWALSGGCSNASVWRARLPPIQPSCSSMNRSALSMRSRARTCSECCSICGRGRRRRPC